MYIYKILLIFIVGIFLVGCSTETSLKSQNTVINTDNIKNIKKENINNDIFSQDTEQKVIISTNTLGRSNPFKPYVERSLSSLPLSHYSNNVSFSKPQIKFDPNIAKLKTIKVNGILYDSSRASAIINFENTDYVVHKGDMLFDYYVKNITLDKVVLQYQKSIYSAGIGEIIENSTLDNSSNTNHNYQPKVNNTGNLPQIKLPPHFNMG